MATSSVPFIGFGFMDNSIMILAGEAIEVIPRRDRAPFALTLRSNLALSRLRRSARHNPTAIGREPHSPTATAGVPPGPPLMGFGRGWRGR